MSSKEEGGDMKADSKPALVPKRRFPEFRGIVGWEEIALGAVARLRNGYAFKSSEYVDSGQFQIITIANVQQGTLSLDTTKRIAVLPSDIQPHQKLRVGDILISMTGNVGRVCRVTSDALLQNQRVGKLIPERINSDFFYHSLQQEEFRNTMQLKAAGGAQGNLSSGDITEYAFLFPSQEREQKKIADCLSSADEAIAAQARKVDALKKHKKGLMQQLFPREGKTQPRLRFPEFREVGEWESTPLARLLERSPDYGVSLSAVPFSKELPTYLRITDISDDGLYLKEKRVSVDFEAKSENYLKLGDIVLARTGASVGKSYRYREEDGALVFAGFLIRIRPDQETLLPDFLSGYLASDTYWDWVAINSARSGQPGINSAEYSSLLIPLPPKISEQQCIASCLGRLDTLITIEAQKLEVLNCHKRGLMQQLFPSPVGVEE
jgi:type I restriction enzyme, S subunit